MQYLVDAAQMRRADQNMIENFEMPQSVLMERAALASYEAIISKWNDILTKDSRILIAVGNGNNGGDGVALGRLLSLAGYRVTIWLSGMEEKYSQALQHQLRLLRNIAPQSLDFLTGAKPQESFQLIVDALFGTGLSRPLDGIWKEMIQWMNQTAAYRMALDLPSGISADTGQILGEAFCADMTVTFEWIKRGCLLYPGKARCGELVVRDIGIAKESFQGDLPNGFTLTEDPAFLLPRRKASGHKGSFGKVLLIAGSENTPGAAILAAKAIMRGGAGMLRVLTPECNRDLLIHELPEAMITCYQAQEPSAETKTSEGEQALLKAFAWCDAVAAGPGIGTGDDAVWILEETLLHYQGPLILDADALTLLADDSGLYQRMMERARNGAPTVLTPHMAEFSRLLHVPVNSLLKMRMTMIQTFCENTNCILVSKDAATVVGFLDGQKKFGYYVNMSGNSGMATAGSGDVLTGILGTLMAQCSLQEKPGQAGYCKAAATGVYLHGLAGDAAASKLGEASMLAGDIAEAMILILKQEGR